MSKNNSFLSPANINFLILKLRGIYPEQTHHDIRENVPYIAHDWFYSTAVSIEQQFVGGTVALNQAFFAYLFNTRRFMPEPQDLTPSYGTPTLDPYIPNQPFQNLNNDMIYESRHLDFSMRSSPLFNQVNKELREATIGGIPLEGNIVERKISALAIEISRKRDKKVKARNLTWGIKKQKHENYTVSEMPFIPRKKFTLPRDFQEAPPQYGYWLGMQPCGATLENGRLSSSYLENVYKYPNHAFYQKDIIPTIKTSAFLDRFSFNTFG